MICSYLLPFEVMEYQLDQTFKLLTKDNELDIRL